MSWASPKSDEQDLADDVLTWCRITLSKVHKPYGVNSVSLALVAHTGKQHPIANARFSVLEPVDFYAMGPGESGARDVLQAWLREGILSKPGTRLSAVLFAWRDLAQELVQTG